MFDAIFEHVDDPPATPVADNPDRVVKWLKQHVREPLETYFAYRGRFGSGHQGVARAAGFTGKTSQSPLLTYMTFKSHLQGLGSEAGREAHGGKKGHEGSDAIGTLHVAHFVPFEHNHIGFFTVYRR